MASIHETIAYTAGKLTELLDTTVLTGTIVSVDYVLDTARVNIGGTEYSNVPIFYHCYGSEEVAGGSVAFAEGDSVYVLNKEGSLTITGFVDGLKSCGWKFKLYRDDDTTIRDGNGNIKTPSGLLIDIWSFNGIYLFDETITYGGLPAIRGWGSAYWTYNSETGIWTYDDSIDWPDDAWKGTYNTNTGYFTIETNAESLDKLYWAEYYTAEPTTITDPAINAAVSTSKVDNYAGVDILLRSTGNPQTLQPPTDKTEGRTFVVRSYASNNNLTITVNGIIIAAGMSQGFTWDGEAWQSSSTKLPYGLTTQYPYRYKEADKEQVADKISLGSYEVNIPYWELDALVYSPEPVVIPAYIDCDEFEALSVPFAVILSGDPSFYGTEYFRDGFDVFKGIKTSIPYKTSYRYRIQYAAIDKFGPAYASFEACEGGTLSCGDNLWACSGTDELTILFSSDDGALNKVWDGWAFLAEAMSDWINPPESVEILAKSNISVDTQKLSGYCAWCWTYANPPSPSEKVEVPTTLTYLRTRGLYMPTESGWYGPAITLSYE